MKKHINNLVLASLLVACGVILPVVFHSVPNAGSILLPMHIPVLLCGIVCGWPYGLACGLLTPLLSALFTGMPPMAYLPAMLCELAAYGLIAGLLGRWIHTGKHLADIYIQLIGAMLLGRVVYGIVNALIFHAGSFPFETFITAAFVTALPGIVIQLVFLPSLVMQIEKIRFSGSRP